MAEKKNTFLEFRKECVTVSAAAEAFAPNTLPSYLTHHTARHIYPADLNLFEAQSSVSNGK